MKKTKAKVATLNVPGNNGAHKTAAAIGIVSRMSNVGIKKVIPNTDVSVREK